MPVATYTLSHKDTGSILSYCVLEKQALPDAAAVIGLRDRLVGDKLVISLKTPGGPGFSFSKSDLVVDEVSVDDTTQADFTQDPFGYVLSLPDASTTPGDGKLKQITSGTTRTLTLHATGKLTVLLPTGLGPLTKMVGIVEGQPPVPITLAAPNSSVDIPLAGSFPLGKAVAVIFLGQGLTSSVSLLKVVA